jgi:hypothetical protein
MLAWPRCAPVPGYLLLVFLSIVFLSTVRIGRFFGCTDWLKLDFGLVFLSTVRNGLMRKCYCRYVPGLFEITLGTSAQFTVGFCVYSAL